MKLIPSNRISSMRGFSLVEVAIASTIAMSTVIFGLYWLKFNAYVDQGRSVGQQYITLNDAVNNYMVTYSQQLAQINTSCSETTFAIGTPTPLSQNRQNATCTLTIAEGKTVANGLQPTGRELQSLGFLPPSPRLQNGLLQIEVPNIKHDDISGSYVVQADPNFPNGNPNGTYAYTPFRLFINIETVCLQRGTASNPNTNPAVSITPEITGCPSTTTTAFKSLIFNTQRYVDAGKGNNLSSPALFASVMEKIGNDGLSSGLSSQNLSNLGDLYGKNFNIRNPIRVIDNRSNPITNIGLAGIIAVRGGYGASYAMQHSRTDGSNPPTANWDFGAHDLSNVINLNASNIFANNKMKVTMRAAGAGCNMDTENIAVDANNDLLTCKKNYNVNGVHYDGIWSGTRNSGTVDFTRYYEVNMEASVDYAQGYTINDCYTVKGTCKEDHNYYPNIVCSFERTTKCNSRIPYKISEFIPYIKVFRSGNPNHESNKNDDLGYEFNDWGDGYYKLSIDLIWYTYLTIRFYPIAQ